MSDKVFQFLCVLAVSIQFAFSQCISSGAVAADLGFVPGALGAPYGMRAHALANEGLAAPFAYDGRHGWTGRSVAYDGIYPAMVPAMDFTPTSGGGLPITSASAIPPTGISVVSENVFEGSLAMIGEIPFVGTTSTEGVLPSVGAGAINHACGNGIKAMISETIAPEYAAAAIAPAAAIVPGAAIAPVSYSAPGLGCRTRWSVL